MNECSVSGTTVVSTVLDSCLVSGTSVLSAVPDSHCSFVSVDGNALDIPGPSTFFPAAVGSSPVQFDLNSETSRFSGTTSSVSQGVAEDHLGFFAIWQWWELGDVPWGGSVLFRCRGSSILGQHWIPSFEHLLY